MTRGLSSTVLLASSVRHACKLALAVLKDERYEQQRVVELDWIRNFCSANRLKAVFMTADQIIEKMPDYMKLLYNQHRKDDMNTLSALASLCAAAEEANPAFTIQMTADDFRLIANFYEGVLR